MPAIGEVYQLAQKFVLPTNDEQMNVFDFLILSASCTDGEFLTALQAHAVTMYSTLLNEIHASVNAQEGIVNELTWSGTEWLVKRYVGQILPPLSFLGGAEALPSATAGLVTVPTTYPRVVGKKYLPTFSELTQNASVLIGSTLGAMVNFCNAMRTITAAGAATYAYNVRRKDGTTVFGYASVAEGIISSQRRRKPGVGS